MVDAVMAIHRMDGLGAYAGGPVYTSWPAAEVIVHGGKVLREAELNDGFMQTLFSLCYFPYTDLRHQLYKQDPLEPDVAMAATMCLKYARSELYY